MMILKLSTPARLYLCSASGKELFWGRVVVFCTLLGPEGPGRRLKGVVIRELGTDGHVSALRSLDLGLIRTFSVVRGRYRPYFENYTVDASILDTRATSASRLWSGCWFSA